MSWVVATDLSPNEQRQFSGWDTTRELQGELVNDSKTNYTQKVLFEGKFYYVKRYLVRGKNLRRYIGPSRVAKEWKNLNWFRRHGIPTPRLVAMGEAERFSDGYWGVIVTEEIPQAIDLRKVYQNSEKALANRSWRLKVITRLAEAVAAMHNLGFIHNDLQWRNVLVTHSADPEVYLIDCPAGRYIYLLGNRRGVVRDLAFLDKMARLALTKTDRLRFYMLYRKIRRLGEADKKEIRWILNFLIQ